MESCVSSSEFILKIALICKKDLLFNWLQYPLQKQLTLSLSHGFYAFIWMASLGSGYEKS